MTTLIPKYYEGATSSVNRPINEKLIETISVKDFGAVGDGSTNDAAAIQAAFNAVAALSTGGCVFFPAGNYVSLSSISITITANKSIAVLGTGEGATSISFGAATDGIRISLGSAACATVQNLSIIRTYATGVYANNGLTIFVTAPGTPAGSVRVQNVTIKGNAARTTAWAYSLVLNDLQNPVIDNVSIYAPDADGSTTSEMIGLYGSSSSSYSADVKISNVQIVGGYKAISISGYSQGVYITNSALIGCEYGVSWTSGTDGELLAFSNNHVNARTQCLNLTATSECLITNNLFLRFTNGAASWAAMYLSDASVSTIHGNTIYGNLSGTETGITINATTAPNGLQPTSITGNVIAALNNAGIGLTGYTKLTSVKSNIFNGVLGGGVINTTNPLGNYIFDNVVNPSGNSGNDFQQRSGTILLGNTVSDATAQLNINGASGYPLALGVQTSASSYQAAFWNTNGVVGSIQTSGSATSYVTSSDYRLKQNILPMTGALDKVLQLNPVTYTWKIDNVKSQGFIAHELQEIVPECVTGKKDAVDVDGKPIYQGIDTSFLIATLSAAIKELSAKVIALEEQVINLGVK